MSLLLAIFPREEKFHDLMHEMVVFAADSVQTFKTLLATANGTVLQPQCEAMRAIKAKAKQAKQKVTLELSKSFMTPFDREDIQEYVNALYRITNTLDNVAMKVAQLSLSPYKSDFQPFIDILESQARVMGDLSKALQNLKNAKAVFEASHELSDWEDKADEVLVGQIRKLMDSGSDPFKSMVLKDVFDLLEHVTDSYRDAGNVAVCLVLKHT